MTEAPPARRSYTQVVAADLAFATGALLAFRVGPTPLLVVPLLGLALYGFGLLGVRPRTRAASGDLRLLARLAAAASDSSSRSCSSRPTGSSSSGRRSTSSPS